MTMSMKYHEILLNYSTTSDGLLMRENDKNIAMTIIDFLSTGEKTSTDIEHHALKKYNDVDAYKVRSILFILEENEISRWSMRVVPLPERPMNKFCYCSLVNYDENSFSRIIEGKIEGKVERILSNFIEGESQYFCKTKENNCTNGLIYTFSKMVENGNTCPSCGAPLCEMDDDDKKMLVSQMISSMPPFVKKERLLQKMYSAIFPGVTKIATIEELEYVPAVSRAANVVSRSKFDLGSFVPATFEDAVMLIDRVPATSVNVPFSVISPGNGHAVVKSIVHQVIPVSGKNGLKYFTIPDVIAMNQRDVMIECFKRWLVATNHAIDVLMQGKQSESRKKVFSVSKLFFFASMGKKYLSKAIVGTESREVFTKIDEAMALMESEGLMHVESFHPKFLPNGVKLFMSMCKSGDVYHYDEDASKIESAESEFWAINTKVPDRSKPISKKFTIRVHDDAYRNVPSFLVAKDFPVLPPIDHAISIDFFSVRVV